MIRYAKIPLPVNVHQMQKEVKQLPAGWTPHLNTTHYSGNWDILSLRSPGGLSNNPVADITDPQQCYANTSLMEACPAIHHFVNTLQCEIRSVRLMNLKSGASIKPHRDFDLCFEKGEARLHVPVFTNSQVHFYSETTRIPMQEGECWYLNANIKHQVSNEGESDRIHLVIDCVVNDWIINLFQQAEKDEVAEKINIEETKAMIEALKTHHTTGADAMIAKLEALLTEQA